ncbi:MAG TPA: LysM peptidoglycan-binding domain-containing protein [Clostridiales bacterium]|nr:LysM peptidoglycan-binding domain-containing protein [Clostridiales bacterium]
MQIHVVRPGDTLWRIAQLYSVTVDLLATSNEIPNPDRLVIGQALVIPIWGSYHWVAPGETLYQISLMYNVPLAELIRINRITNPDNIPVGLRLYIPQKPRPLTETAAYIDIMNGSAAAPAIVNRVGIHLTYLNIFSYAINRDGSLDPISDESTIQAAYRQRAMPLMVLTNFEDGTFSQDLATAVLSSEALQNTVLNNSVSVMQQKGYGGLNVDFEYLGAVNRERYNAFMRRAAARLRPLNLLLSSALAPKYSADQQGTLYEGHDYRAHGETNDMVFLMTYEWGWAGGPPMAVSPINEVRAVMEYAITEIPKNKIMMGIPLYGYDWTLPYVRGGPFARSISPQQAIALALRYNTSIEYDTTAQAPFFNYADEQGRQHIVWFEDARSIQAKFNLVKELGIRGFFYWVLGNDFPQNWLLIEDNFVVRKLV